MVSYKCDNSICKKSQIWLKIFQIFSAAIISQWHNWELRDALQALKTKSMHFTQLGWYIVSDVALWFKSTVSCAYNVISQTPKWLKHISRLQIFFCFTSVLLIFLHSFTNKKKKTHSYESKTESLLHLELLGLLTLCHSRGITNTEPVASNYSS